MEQLPKIVRERLQASPKPEVHPDSDLLTAFAENSLPERERTPVLAHLARCGNCREIVALAAPEVVLEHVAAVAAVPASPVRTRPAWPSRLIFGWGTLAACVAIGVLLLRYQSHEKNLPQLASREAAPANVVPRSNEAASIDAKKQPSFEPPASPRMTARLESPPSPQGGLKSRGKRESDAGKVSDMRAERLDEQQAGAGAAPGETAGALALRPAPPMPQKEQVTVSGGADQVAVADKPKEGPPIQVQPSKVANQAVVGAAPRATEAETKQAAAAPPPPPAPSSQSKTSVNSIAAFSRRKDSFETAQAVALEKETAGRMNANYVPTRWSISADGATLLRSNDEGRSWPPVKVASNVTFRAVTSFGTEVWAGGNNGALYHSSDLGQHWVKVKPSANGVELTKDIVSLDFADSQHGKLTTADGKVWTTSDGGVSWQVQ